MTALFRGRRSYCYLTVFPLEPLQPRNSKDGVEPFAVDGHCLILMQIHVQRQIIILIALIPLQRSEFHVIKPAFHNLLVECLVLRPHQQHMHVRPIRGREIRKPQILFSIGGFVNRRPPPGPRHPPPPTAPTPPVPAPPPPPP